MHQGDTGRTMSPLESVEVSRPPERNASLQDCSLQLHEGDSGDDMENDQIPQGVLIQKSCVQEKTKGNGGFFQRLVGHGGKQQKYHVGTSFDLETITATSPEPDEFHALPPSDSIYSTQMTQSTDKEVLEDIPLNVNEKDINAATSNTSEVLVAPQVVIHESPQKSNEVATSAMGYRHPILHKQSSAAVECEDSIPVHVLLTVVSASNLLKVHKFGVQAPYLEMKISSDDTTFRSAECKNGGTEAQWNQTFTRRVGSIDDTLHIAAKASTTIIGEVTVTFRSLDLSSSLSNHTLQLSRGKTGDCVGQICLQCRLLDPSASSTAANSPCPVAPLPIIPPLPIPSLQDKPVEPKVSVAKVRYNEVADAGTAWDTAIRKGSLMFKIPYHQSTSSAPKRKWISLQELPKRGLCITWADPQNPDTSHQTAHMIPLHDVVEIKTGIKTQAFRKQHAAQGKTNTFFHESVCFSLISASRSLDLAASSKEEAAIWVTSLRRMLQQQTTKAEDTSIITSARIMKDFKTAATTSEKTTHATWIKELFRCAKSQQLGEIASYLMDGCPVDLLEPQTGDTILFLACRSGHVALLELCLKWGAKNDPHPTFGDTALQIAVKASQPECVRQLLSIAAKSDMDTEIVNHVDHANQAPLHVAASQGDLVCLQLLLHHGADICVVQANGHTPLHCAVLAGHESCVAYILDVGGDAIINTGDSNGNTPLHCAVSMNHEGLVKLLLESAADVTISNNELLTPYKMARRTKSRAIQALLAIYEPEPPTPSKETSMNWTTPPNSARLQVRDALAKQMHNAASPVKSISARSSSTFEGDFDGYTSSSSTSTCIGENSSYYTDFNQPASYNGYHHPSTPYAPPSQQYPTYAYQHTIPSWSQEWEVKYTTDGHAYYVNLYTGISQWEVPPALQGYDPYAYGTANVRAYEPSPILPAAPVYDSSSQYIRTQLAAARNQLAPTMPPGVPTVHTIPELISNAPSMYGSSTPSSATPSPSASPRSKPGFSERRKLQGLHIETLNVVTAPLPEQGVNIKLEKLNDEGDIFQKSRSRSPKGKSKTVKVLDIKRANNIVMTLSDFEFQTQFDKITQAIIDMDEESLNLEKVRCLKGLFPTDDEKENLLARQADKGEFGKAEKFMMACLEVDDINARADCFLFKLKFSKSMTQLRARIEIVVGICQAILDTPVLCSLLQQMLEDKKQNVMWEDEKYKEMVERGLSNGDIPTNQWKCLKKINTVPDTTCLLRSELQDDLDTIVLGCRSCQSLLKSNPKNSCVMSPHAINELEKFVKSSVGQVNDITEELRSSKTWENKLVSEFGIVLENFNPHEILHVVKQLI